MDILNQVLSLVPGAMLDTIQIANSAMTIEVYNLKYNIFRAKAEDRVLYAAGDDPLAFLVKDFDPDQENVIRIAIRWYGLRMEYTDMMITDIDPRPPVKLRIVK